MANSPLVLEATEANFKAEVLDSEVPTVVDFWAEWCGPCRALAPTFESLAQTYKGKVKAAKLNVDENPEIAMRYRVQAIPTIIAFKGGEVLEQVRGPRKSDLERFFEAVASR